MRTYNSSDIRAMHHMAFSIHESKSDLESAECRIIFASSPIQAWNYAWSKTRMFFEKHDMTVCRRVDLDRFCRRESQLPYFSEEPPDELVEINPRPRPESLAQSVKTLNGSALLFTKKLADTAMEIPNDQANT